MITRKPRIGLISDSEANRHLLANLLRKSYFEIATSLSTKEIADYLNDDHRAPRKDHLDLWLLDTARGSFREALIQLEERSEKPLLINDQIPIDNSAEYEAWQCRLINKLHSLTLDADNDLGNSKSLASPNHVWVLAGSLGGPEAVKPFVNALPEKLPVSFIYAQHIEQHFDTVLTEAFSSQAHYRVKLLQGKNYLREGEVAIVPADHQLRFLEHGGVVSEERPWSGQSQPDLDQIISDLAKVYRHKLGVIIFSGLCNDGEQGCRIAKACGATVWAQQAETCVNSAMPDAAISTGCVSYQGSPEELAEALAMQLQQSTNYRQSTNLYPQRQSFAN